MYPMHTLQFDVMTLLRVEVPMRCLHSSDHYAKERVRYSLVNVRTHFYKCQTPSPQAGPDPFVRRRVLPTLLTESTDAWPNIP
jgi:hypothetical protein